MDDDRPHDQPAHQPADVPGGDGPAPAPPERSGGRLTTTIPRPVVRRASDAGRSRLATGRRGDRGDRISSRRSAWLFGLGAVVVASAIAAALFVLPVRTWFDQDDQISALEYELTEMQAVNRDLTGEVDRLQSADGIREAAREELGQVQAGDRRLTMLEAPPLPRDLPAGWPYTHVDQILTMREAGPTASEPQVGEGDDDSGSGGFEPVAPVAPAPPATTTTPAVTTTTPATSTSVPPVGSG